MISKQKFDPTSLWQRWFDEVWHEENDSAIDRMAHPDCIFHGIADSVMTLDEIKTWRKAFLTCYAVRNGKVLDPIIQGEWISVRSEFDFLIRDQAESQRTYGQQRARIRDEKFVEVWDSWSWSPALEKFGIVKAGSLSKLLNPGQSS